MCIPGDLKAMMEAESTKKAQTAAPPPQTGAQTAADDPSAPYQKYIGKVCYDCEGSMSGRIQEADGVLL
jgi:hypothetical protein